MKKITLFICIGALLFPQIHAQSFDLAFSRKIADADVAESPRYILDFDIISDTKTGQICMDYKYSFTDLNTFELEPHQNGPKGECGDYGLYLPNTRLLVFNTNGNIIFDGAAQTDYLLDFCIDNPTIPLLFGGIDCLSTRLNPGMYIFQLQVDSEVITKKLYIQAQ